jgi:acetyl-CoA carboxylase biotin carboxyl carrier protein
MAIDGDSVKQLATILSETGLSEIEYDTGTLRIRVARTLAAAAPVYAAAPAAVAAAAPALGAPAPAAAADIASNPGCLKSPMVGVVYVSPEPGAAPYIKVGDQVTAGQTVLIIEAMKTFNQVKAHKAGRVSQIMVADKNPVEYGEPLMLIE